MVCNWGQNALDLEESLEIRERIGEGRVETRKMENLNVVESAMQEIPSNREKVNNLGGWERQVVGEEEKE